MDSTRLLFAAIAAGINVSVHTSVYEILIIEDAGNLPVSQNRQRHISYSFIFITVHIINMMFDFV